MNDKYTKALQDFTVTANPSSYIILGSVALLSYTQKHGYDREVHDIDIIMEKAATETTKKDLINKGYVLETFINPRMPFYNKLMKHSEDRYLRFSKEGVNIEILSSDIKSIEGLYTFEIYPGIKASFPSNQLMQSDFNGVNFSTVTKEMIYFIKSFANGTFGRWSTYKEKQRLEDFKQLGRLVDKEKVEQLIKDCTFSLFGLKIKTPKFLIKRN